VRAAELAVRTRRVDGRIEVLAPAAGWWSRHPGAGHVLAPGQSVGVLQVLHRRFVLVLPDGAAGAVRGELPASRRVGVEYGQPLLVLDPAGVAEASARAGDVSADAGPTGSEEVSGYAVLAPTDGVFYCRPAPGTAPFVEVGQTVRRGQPIGLVESMKTFNQIVLGGPGAPDEGEVVEILVEDEAEIRSGQALLRVR
jgi:acetyl-CoA carboxylase biotin carboxyl carrier protein